MCELLYGRRTKREQWFDCIPEGEFARVLPTTPAECLKVPVGQNTLYSPWMDYSPFLICVVLSQVIPDAGRVPVVAVARGLYCGSVPQMPQADRQPVSPLSFFLPNSLSLQNFGMRPRSGLRRAVMFLVGSVNPGAY